MKIRLLLITPLLFFSVILLSQINRKKNVSNGKLDGTITFMTIFVDTSEDQWESEERDYFFAEFERSQEWINDQAFGYGQEVEFDNDGFFFDNKEIIYVDAVNMGENSPSQIVRKIVKKRGYLSFAEFLKKKQVRWFY